MGLAYTAPLRTLRITGGPRTKHSRKFALPANPWGNKRDLQFLSNEHAKGYGKDEFAPHEIYRVLDAKSSRGGEIDKGFCVKMLRHYQSTARTRAALALARLGAADELIEALDDPDPRVRRAACEGIDLYGGWSHSTKGGFPPAVVSERFLPGIEAILKDPEAAWWELDGALLALGRAEPADIHRNIGAVRRYLDHEEWFLREGAGLCLAALAQDEALFHQEQPLLIDYIAKERHLFPRRAVLSFLRKYQTNKAISIKAKQDIIAGLMTATKKMPLLSGHLSGMTFNNRYEMMRFFYGNAPELSGQILDEAEHILAQPDGVNSCNVQWYLTGEGWGNPGVLKSLAKLPAAERPALFARCKQFLEKLKEKQLSMKEKSEDTKRIDRFVVTVDKAILDYANSPPKSQ